MRVLAFNVEGQRLSKASYCDFEGIVAGSSGYLYAEFNCDEDWDGCTIVASFWTRDMEHLEYREYAAVVDGPEADIFTRSVEIPADALKDDTFYISLIGVKPGYRITTNKIKVTQEVM